MFARCTSLLAAALLCLPNLAYAGDYTCPMAIKAPIRQGDACASSGGGFTATRKRNNGKRVPHRALDLDAPEGEPVYAIHAGTIAYAQGFGAIGKVVILDHGDGEYSVYGHMSEIMVNSGDAVQAGDRVGSVGYSGNAKCLKEKKLSAHLHFATYRPGKTGLGTGESPLIELTTGDGSFHPKERLGDQQCWAKP